LKKKLLPALILSITSAIAGYSANSQASNLAEKGVFGALAGAVAGAAIDHNHRLRGASIGGAFGGAVGGTYGNYLDEQEAALRSQTLGAGISMTREQDRINVVLAGEQFFQPGSAQLSPNAINVLNEIANSLRQFPNSRLEITGYSDGVGSPYERAALSQKRANAASMFLQAQGIDISRLTLFNVTDPSPKNRAAERRLEIAINPGQQVAAQRRNPALGGGNPALGGGARQPAQPQYQYAAQQQHTNVYTPTYSAGTNRVRTALGNGLIQGVAGALRNGPAAGLAAGVGSITRSATQETTRAVNQTVNNEIHGAIYDYSR